MNVAVVTRACYPFHGHGGLERHVFDLVRHLIACGVRVTLVAPPDPPASRHAPARGHTAPPASAAARAGGGALRNAEDEARRALDGCLRYAVPYRTFPLAGRRGTTVIDRSTAYPLFGRRAGRLAADLVRRGDVDLVYGLGASVLGYAEARRRGAPAPLVFNPQGLEEFGATDPGHAGGRLKRAAYAPLRAAVRACARAADRVIATDAVLEPVVRRHLAVAPDRVRVVPNAIDIDGCDRWADCAGAAAVRTRHRIEEHDAVLLSVGRLEANKGFDVLARALARLRREDAGAPSWRWVLVGEGPHRRSIERAIDEGGLRDRVLLTGRLGEAELHAWYEASNVFVHPTLYEGSSLVTLEAMAHRRAVVATTAGGLPDKVRPGVSGWLVPPDDAGALEAAIREALGNPDRLPAMGEEGRRIAIARFSWPSVIELFLAVCAELLESHPR